ncbi:MAG: acetolactate decarboxylase [Eubacterium sp.]|nr:acetolactate decarboxylase [Eubacterium sp.]
MEQVMYQVSTLQALAMGYSKAVVSVEEFLENGNIGLGTFEDVDGEMIMVDGKCYRALEDGAVVEAESDRGVPFAVTSFFEEGKDFSVQDIEEIDRLKQILDVKIEEDFGLNSMHMVRIDGSFSKVCARSESAYRSHVETVVLLSKQKIDKQDLS